MSSIDHLQTYLRESARQRYEAIPVPPFTVFLHRSSDLIYFNYATPDQPTSGDLQPVLAELRDVFIQRSRQPRFEFIEEFAPELAPALEAAGFVEESRTQFMICTPDTYRDAPAVRDLVISALNEQSPLSDLRDFLTVQRRSFGSDADTSIDDDEAAELQGGMHAVEHFLVRSDAQAVGVGSLTAPIAGVAEVAGIGTLERFRRRGVATMLTAHMLQRAFSSGVEIACLSAADERAGRVYERVGFRAVATTLAYIESAAEQ